MRLTNSDRKTIAGQMADNALSARDDAAADLSQELFDEVYPRVVPREVQKQLSTIPDRFLTLKNYIPVAVTSSHVVHLKNRLRVVVPSGSDIFPIPDDRPDLVEKVKTLSELTGGRYAEYRRLRSEALAALANFSTWKKLRDGWPELGPILDRLEPKPVAPARLPAIPLERLNQVFKLPPEEVTQ